MGLFGWTDENCANEQVHFLGSQLYRKYFLDENFLPKNALKGHFRVAVNLIMKARLSAKAFHMKIIFVCVWMKTNFHNKSFALSLAFIMRFTATRKWPIRQPVFPNDPTIPFSYQSSHRRKFPE